MTPRNLLILMSDEHDPRYMGCSGHPLIRTPNLDRLAARGTRFTAAYTNSPICVPARASFATGRLVHEIGYWDNAIAWDGRVPGWTHALQRAGIRTATIGKLHYRRAEDPLGIDEQIEPMHILDGVGQAFGSVRDPMPEVGPPMRMLKQIGPGESSYNKYDRTVADRAAAWLADAARRRSDPFVLYVGLVAPHFPLVAPQRYFDLYPRDRLPFPRLHPRHGHARHPWVEAMHRFNPHDDYFRDDAERMLAVAAYHALCTFMDEQVGRVLATLEASGLSADTRVIYTSDHGDNLGARGLWGKSVLYEESVRVPLIAAGPEVPAGKTCGTAVSLRDVFATVLDGAGLDVRDAPSGGRSLFALAGAADDPGRIAFSEYHAIGAPTGAFMLRRGRYKYHHYVGYAPELFDLAADPGETRDLAGDPAHAETLADCERALRAICDPAAVDRRAKDDQNALVARLGGIEKALTIGPKGATPAPSAAQE